MNKEKSIGIFDSGFGGLNILRGIVKELPEYNFIYLGDTARVPYGTRSKEVVYQFTKQALDFLFHKNCDLIIFACNTASGYSLHKIQNDYIPRKYPDKKALGVIIPTVEFASSKTKNKRVGVIATEGTVSSNAFEKELYKIDHDIKIFQSASPLLVPIIEAGEHNSKAADIFLKKYLKPLLKNKIDTLILGCTHYGIIENKIKKMVGKKVSIVSEARIVAKKLAGYLKRHPEIENNLGRESIRIFYSTDLTENFKILGSKFFGKKIIVKKARLGDRANIR